MAMESLAKGFSGLRGGEMGGARGSRRARGLDLGPENKRRFFGMEHRVFSMGFRKLKELLQLPLSVCLSFQAEKSLALAFCINALKSKGLKSGNINLAK